MLDHAARDMRVVMLHADRGRSNLAESVLGGEIVGMKIVRDHAWFDIEQIFEMLDGFDKRVEGLVILEIANVMTQERMTIFAETKCVLQMPAAAEHGPSERDGHRNRLWRIAARPTDDHFRSIDRTRHGVVDRKSTRLNSSHVEI